MELVTEPLEVSEPPPPPREEAAAQPRADAAAVAPRLPALGEVLRGRYRVCSFLGEGGSGAVVEALDAWRLAPPEGDQRVALKLLRPEVGQEGPRFAAFQREFQHLQSLSHPNIVRVHDFDRDGAVAFFTMEYLSGAQLGEVLAARRGQPLPRAHALAILRDVGAAVAHAHAHDIAHGDLNPANILVTDAGQIRVLDFGASHQLPAEPWIAAPDDPPRVATRAWASCQVLECGVPVARDDVYSLACIAYLLLTGTHPFGGRSALEARTARLRPRRPAALRGRAWGALRSGLRFDRERRPGNVEDWLRRLDLRGAARQLPPLAQLIRRQRPRRPWLRWLVGAGATALVLGLSWWAGVHAGLARWPISLSGAAAGLSAAAASGSRQPDPVLPATAPATQPVTARTTPAAAAAPVKSPPAGPSVAKPAEMAHATASRRTVKTASVTEASRASIELTASHVDVVPRQTIAVVVVRRSGGLRGDVGFTWWTESGTAQAGRDFANMKPRAEYFRDGQRELSLLVPLVDDPQRRAERSFYVVIDGDAAHAAVGPRKVAQVTLAPAG